MVRNRKPPFQYTCANIHQYLSDFHRSIKQKIELPSIEIFLFLVRDHRGIIYRKKYRQRVAGGRTNTYQELTASYINVSTKRLNRRS